MTSDAGTDLLAIQQAKKLLLPGEMGERFKVMALTRGDGETCRASGSATCVTCSRRRSAKFALALAIARVRSWRSASPSSSPARPCAARSAAFTALAAAQRLAQQCRLRVGRSGQAQAAARVGLTGREEILESIRPAEGIHAFEHREQRRRPQLQRAMAHAVVAGHGAAELAEAVRRAEATAQLPASVRRCALRERRAWARVPAASCPCRGRAPARRSAPRVWATGARSPAGPSAGARRCRSPGATVPAAARPTAHRLPGRSRPARRSRAARK